MTVPPGTDAVSNEPHPNAIRRRCGAKTRSGAPCRGLAMPNGRCRIHGGKSLSGIAHPGFKHGRYSQDVPTRLRENYERARQDVNLLALQDDIAVLEAHLGDLMQRLDSGDSGAHWPRLLEVWADFRSAQDRRDAPAMRDAVVRIEALLHDGAAEAEAWEQIVSVMDARRKLITAERKRIMDAQQMLSSEQAFAMIAALMDSVRRHVHDRVTLAAIASDVARIAG